ncbi:PAS domain-containing protein [Salinimicrobium gaetbulicola]|uniref:histidine kinase n=1 Tax=Salinimicrobium gaetbulicola TaxID=999702 RepID=A0ABW3IH87_9FLAO
MIDYQQIFNLLTIPSLLLEPVEDSFVVKDVTSGYCEVIGRKKEDLIGCVIPEIFLQDPSRPTDDPQIFIDLLKKTRETGHTHCMGASRYDIYNPVTGQNEKRFCSVENIPISDESGNEVKFILHTIFDKTSEVLAKEKNCSLAADSTDLTREPVKIDPDSEVNRSEMITPVEEKYKTLIKGSFDLCAVLDKEGTIKFVGESSEKILGVPVEELIGKNAFEYIHPEDKERVVAFFEENKTKETSFIAPYRCADSLGNYKWFQSQMRNRLNDPTFAGIVLNTKEITDLINKTDEIEELNERYRLATSASGDLIYEWNLKTNAIERFFRDNERHFGYEKKDLQQLTQWGENIHPDELDDLKTLLKNTLNDPARDQIRSQYRFKRKDGTYAHIIDRAQIIRNKEGEAVRLVGATIDISSIIERKNALKIANKRFTYAMKATQEMIWDWDMIEDKIERSKAFEKIIGPDSEDLPSPDYSWYEIVDHKDQKRVKASLDRALSNPEVTMWHEEYEIYPRNSRRRFVTDRAYIIRNAEGKAVRMVGATLDVTESREMMKAIEAQNKVLKEIAWEQAHIVRTPLARIMGLLEFMDDPLNREMDQKEILQLIKDSTYELDSIVTKIVRRTEDVEA